MTLTTKNINKRYNVVDLTSYSESTVNLIKDSWNFKKEANLKIDLWTLEENIAVGTILAIDITESHTHSNVGSGYAYVYYSDDRNHYIQRKMIYANTKGLYIEYANRTYLDLPAIKLEELEE